MPQTIPIPPLSPDRFRDVLTPAQADAFEEVIIRGRELFAGRVIWNVNSTAAGGGVAEMLRSLIAYGRGAGIDARWVVVDGSPPFFRTTKRIHNRLHGSAGDGGRLGVREREIYERTGWQNAENVARLIAPGDIVLLHDPQTAPMVTRLKEAGAHVIWRCHVGIDTPNRLARSAWRFLLPHVAPADAYVFSRDTFAWNDLDRDRLWIIPPSIDAFSPKNQAMTTAAAAAILDAANLVSNGGRRGARYTRYDGTPGRVDRRATVWEDSHLHRGTPMVVHVSRWDALKDPTGTMESFAAYMAARTAAHLVLAGPDVTAVADDPEGLAILDACIERRNELAPEVRSRVHLAALPMEDSDENAAIVNALQRSATVVVQKSIAEGFGLTVSEAMWKARPVVASRVGGIQNQIVSGESGMLVDPHDLEAFGDAVVDLLLDPERAARMGAEAQARVRDEFLGPRHLTQYLELFGGVIEQNECTTTAVPASA